MVLLPGAMDNWILVVVYLVVVGVSIITSFILCYFLRRRMNYSGHVVSLPPRPVVQQAPQRVHIVNVIANSSTPIATTQVVYPSPSAPTYYDQPPVQINQNEYAALPPSYTTLYP
uniref:Uncharacterized protein n=1 Tax=Strigamia maritima TaxID=126957 RepID=T1IPZ7_STRMM